MPIDSDEEHDLENKYASGVNSTTTPNPAHEEKEREFKDSIRPIGPRSSSSAARFGSRPGTSHASSSRPALFEYFSKGMYQPTLEGAQNLIDRLLNDNNPIVGIPGKVQAELTEASKLCNYPTLAVYFRYSSQNSTGLPLKQIAGLINQLNDKQSSVGLDDLINAAMSLSSQQSQQQGKPASAATLRTARPPHSLFPRPTSLASDIVRDKLQILGYENTSFAPQKHDQDTIVFVFKNKEDAERFIKLVNLKDVVYPSAPKHIVLTKEHAQQVFEKLKTPKHGNQDMFDALRNELLYRANSEAQQFRHQNRH